MKKIWFAAPKIISKGIPTYSAETYHSSRGYVIYNLDSNPTGVYCESNLIEARAAAILTPHNAARACGIFRASFPVSSHMFMIQSSQNDCVMDKLREHVLS